MDTQTWYWCLDHDRAEPDGRCPAHVRLGPYPSEAAARDHADVTERRNDRWEAEDRRWRGDS